LKISVKVPLEIIEVQNGEYVGEDDIVRLEDVYGRKVDVYIMYELGEERHYVSEFFGR